MIDSLIVALIVMFTLPESIHFLALKEERWPRLAKIVKAIKPDARITPETRFTMQHEQRQDENFTPKLLFTDGLRFTTPAIWLFYIFNSMAVFFMTSWLPVLVQGEGLTQSHAAITTAIYLVGVGGILGGLLTGWLIDKFGMFTIAIVPALGAVASAILGFSQSELILMVTAFAAGFFVVGTQNAILTVAPMIYPTSYRSKGEGTTVAVGKIGAIVGPVIGGVLLAAQLPVHQLFFFVAAAVLCGAVCAFAFATLFLRYFSDRIKSKEAVAK